MVLYFVLWLFFRPAAAKKEPQAGNADVAVSAYCGLILPSDAELQPRQPFLGARALAVGDG